MIDQYLFCRSCGVLSPLETAHLAAAAGATDADGAADEDLHAFLALHEPHGLTQVERSASAAVYDRAVWDPMGTVWFEVASAAETFLVRASRASIDTARRYELVPGSIQSGRSAVDIDESYLRSALDRHFFPHLLRPATIDQFVAALRSLIASLHAEDIETSFDDSNDPSVGIAPFSDELSERLLSHCSQLFDPWEVERVTSFVDTNRFEDGALALRVRHQLVVMAA